MAIELIRVIAVVALVVIAAALATPRGRVPLALRGVYRIMRRDRGLPETQSVEAQAPLSRRIVAFALVLVAIVLAIF